MPSIICTEFSEVRASFEIEKQLIRGFTFTIIDGPYTNSDVLGAVGTSFQLVLRNFDKMDGIVTGPLNVKFGFHIDHNPCFAAIKFTKHCKTKATVHVNYEN